MARFIAVGCAAAAVHWVGVWWLVSHWAWSPLMANVPAWLLAFGVSFGGHHRWTFGHQKAPLVQSARRFFAVSAAGFAINQGAYALLLRWSPLRFDVALAAVLIAVAAATFLAARHWAFLRIEGPSP